MELNDQLEKKPQQIIKTKDFMVSMESFSLVFNENNLLYKTDPIPKDLQPYYDHKDYISHNDNGKDFFSRFYNVLRGINLKWKFRLVNKYNKHIESAFDFGCGTGAFLNLLKNKGIDISGLEINRSARVEAEKKLNQKILSPNELNTDKNKYDLITLWHVLEHIEDFESVIQNLRSKLNNGGLLVIAVPNFNSFDAYWYKSYWAAYDTPRHINHFSRGTFCLISEKYNFDLIETKGMLFDSYFVSLLSEKYKKSKLRWIKAIIIGTLSNLYGFVKKDYSSQVYILQKSN